MGEVAVIEPRESRPILTAGHRPQAIVPTDFESCYRLANAVVQAQMAPPGLETPEKAMVAIMHGLEVGMTPMAALQRIAVINGRPSIWGDGAMGLVRGSGLCEWIKERIEGEGDDRVAICEAKRKGDPEPIRKTFSVADAKRAGLWDTREIVKRKGKDGWYEKANDAPWFRYPERMLQMRARAFCLRDGFADVLGGLYIKEEIDDGHTPSEPSPPPQERRRAPAPSTPKQIEAKPTESAPAEDTPEKAVEERVQEERTQDEPQPDRRRAPAPNTKPAEPQKMDVVGIAMQRGYEARKGSNIRRGAVPGEYRDAARKDEASAWQDGWDKANAELSDAPNVDVEGVLKAFIARCADAHDRDDVALAWSDIVAEPYPHIKESDQRRLDEAYTQAQAKASGG